MFSAAVLLAWSSAMGMSVFFGKRFATAGEAEISSDGAAGFLNELVKIDRSEEYATELRGWIAEMESHPITDSQSRVDQETVVTTRINQAMPETRILPPGGSASPETETDTGFELDR